MIRLCLDMKIKTLSLIALFGLLAFIFILYATSTAQKVSPRDAALQKQQQQRKTIKMERVSSDDKKRPGVVVEEVTEVWAGDHGRLVRPVDSGLPVIVQSAPREHPDIPNTLGELPAKSTVFTTTELPSDPRLRPGVGNGHVATVVYSDSIYMNGLYNGFNGHSHRARIPGFCALQITGVHPDVKYERTYTLNVTTGIFTDTIIGSSFMAIHRMYAHRKIKELLVSEVILSRSDITKPFGISLQVNRGPDSEDIDFETGQNMIAGSRYVYGRIKTPEFNDTARPMVHVYYGEPPSNITLPESMREGTWLYLTSVSNTQRGAEDQYEKGLKLFQVKSLSYAHTTEWAKLWSEGRIDMEGNPTLARLAYSSLYYLLSCLPSEEDPDWPFVGLSPEGLDHGSANQSYWGHVMWDQETWQYPPLLMLYPKLAATLLHTRTRTLDAAKRQAKLRGFQGAMYPWESGFTGRDITRAEKFGLYEQHITGDIALAVQQYLYMTHDQTFLRDGRGAEMVSAIAEFWASRAAKDPETGKYGIYGVIPPDEYRSKVNNSAYTNAVAELSLMLPYYALPLIGKHPPAVFREIASNMKIPFDERRQYHPEYDGYTIGTKVKQADVILLGFPLMKDKDPVVRRNDLTLYAQATDPKGPAMTWQMFTIGWLEVKDTHQAKMNLLQSIENAKGPFQVWTEEASGSGAVNFRTGMGGYLQALIFGYGGFRILSDGLYFDPTLPTSSKKFTITGLDYLGNSLNFVIDEKNTVITVTKQGEPLVLTIPGMSTHYPLTEDKSVTISKHKAVIKVKTE